MSRRRVLTSGAVIHIHTHIPADRKCILTHILIPYVFLRNSSGNTHVNIPLNGLLNEFNTATAVLRTVPVVP